MPGMKVTLNTAMRVRDVSRPSPQHEDNARAKVTEWPASRARPTPAAPLRGRGGGAAAPRPWRPGAERGETPTARADGGPRKGQGRPAPPAPHDKGQRDAAQRPREAAPAPAPPALPPGPEVSQPAPARGKRVRRRRRRGQAGG
jgi:hypothetical protein